jgi:hypothetical protein
MDVIWLYWLYGHIMAIKVIWLYKSFGYIVVWFMGYIVMG